MLTEKKELVAKLEKYESGEKEKKSGVRVEDIMKNEAENWAENWRKLNNELVEQN